MVTSFDNTIDRRGTDSYKWDYLPPDSTRKDLIPMWVADMDFSCPPEITAALKERTAHGIFGYTARSRSYVDAVLNWIGRRYDWPVKEEWLAFSPPGVIPAISALIHIKTASGDGIILQEPAYGPLKEIVLNSGRKVVEAPLVLENGSYALDLETLDKKIDSKTRMMIFCSPHNPTGRVWTRKELTALGDLCLKHKIFTVSDDVHSDIIYPGHTYLPMGAISPELAQMTATCYSPGKTFNLGGLQTSTLVIPDPEVKQAYEKTMETLQMRLDNLFSATALEAGYTYGEKWLVRLLAYLDSNRQLLIETVENRIGRIQVIPPQGTFLCWLDLNGLNLNARELRRFMAETVGVLPSYGDEYGKFGNGFIRLNIACPQNMLRTALLRLGEAVRKL